MTAGVHIEDYYLSETEEIPNNILLPLLVYRKALQGGGDLASEFERVFSSHGWEPAWRYGIYPFAHYHSNAHEVIGVYRGSAMVLFGHTGGIKIELQTGDAVILPAGTGHQCLESTPEFHAVGAYPKGQEPDLLKPDAKLAHQMADRIDNVPLPTSDPVFGENGPLTELW